MMTNDIRVHRHGDRVAIRVGEGETVYLSNHAANELSESLWSCYNDIQTYPTRASMFKTTVIKGE